MVNVYFRFEHRCVICNVVVFIDIISHVNKPLFRSSGDDLCSCYYALI